MAVKVINLEEGRPTVQTARNKLLQSIRTAKMAGWTVVKFIHGYGSSGKGGAIRTEVHAVLRDKERSGDIRAFVPGEDFSAFDAASRQMVAENPQIARDIDYGRQNHGITMVML